MTTTMIWAAAALTYGLFWCCYVGFKKKITPQKVDVIMQLLDKHGHGTEKQLVQRCANELHQIFPLADLALGERVGPLQDTVLFRGHLSKQEFSSLRSTLSSQKTTF